MRILVTGGAGFIGQHLVSSLIQDGNEVVSLDNHSGGIPSMVGKVEGIVPPTKEINLDISEGVGSSVFQGVDYCFHLAASFANEKSVNHPMLDCRSNIVGTIHIAQATERMGVPMLYAGSSSSYGAHDKRISEDAELKPSTPYALSKAVGESYAKMLNPKTVIARLFNVFGEGDVSGAYRNAIPNMVSKAVWDKEIPIYGMDSVRDFYYVGHVVSALKALMTEGEAGAAYNVCSGVGTPLIEIARIISSIVGGGIKEKPRREWDTIPVRIGDPTQIEALLGIEGIPPAVFIANLENTIRWVARYGLT